LGFSAQYRLILVAVEAFRRRQEAKSERSSTVKCASSGAFVAASSQNTHVKDDFLLQGVRHVKLSCLCATMVAVFIASAAVAPALGQNPRGHNIAVVDVSVIFKKHARFDGMMKKFKKDLEGAEAKMKQEMTEIKSTQEQLKDFTPGSPDFKQMEQRIAKQMADWQLKAQMQKKDFLEQEGRIYYQVYRELDDAVKRFAMKHQIALVLRYASDPVDDPNDRNEIIRGINKPIVYVDPSLDITNWILEDLNRSGAAASGAAPQGVGVRPQGVQR
jgi:Skp family chaperone for outer membrane proteins